MLLIPIPARVICTSGVAATYLSETPCTRKSPPLPQAREYLLFQPTQEGIGTGIAGLITPPDGVNVEGGQSTHTVSNSSARTDAEHSVYCRVRHKGRDALGFFPIHCVPQVRVQPGECASQRGWLGQTSEP